MATRTVEVKVADLEPVKTLLRDAAAQVAEQAETIDRLRDLLHAWHDRYRVTCSQCGTPYGARACGPTHAVVAALLWPEREQT